MQRYGQARVKLMGDRSVGLVCKAKAVQLFDLDGVDSIPAIPPTQITCLVDHVMCLCVCSRPQSRQGQAFVCAHWRTADWPHPLSPEANPRTRTLHARTYTGT